ncbi:HPr kinase/phosphorylase [Sphingobium sp. Z007]|uniref:HPr kinase/phosphorylase n=1 Tax=Sphingobium sp. Z007 TaxID=627495 RepID=UPI000B4A42DC|nr:HPr kinase/phosphatase C-terminal domain-containing protein [Sphingobium sp. Z007]
MARALSSETLHATSVAIDGRVVLLRGPSGSGKSDLALRLIDRGGALVSDDYTLVKRVEGRLIATAPDTIRGRMEVRGIGIVAMAALSDAPVALIADLFDPVDRMPLEPVHRNVAGIDVPVVKISPFEASAPIKVELALKALGLPAPDPS